MARAFDDSHYDGIEAGVERKLGLPAGGLKAIRTRGERTNEGVVSSAGANTVYQIIPATRAGVMKNYNVDAYANDDGQSAAMAAGLVLKERMKAHNGDWASAVADYHGGTDPDNHGPINRAYVNRVTGTNRPVAAAGDIHAGPARVLEGASSHDIYEADWLNSVPGKLVRTPPEHVNTHTSEADRVHKLAVMSNGEDVSGVSTLNPETSFEDVDAKEAAQVKEQQRIDGISVGQRIGAAFSDNSLTAALWRRLGEQSYTTDPKYAEYRKQHLEDITSFAQDADEEDWLLEANSAAEQKAIEGRIEARRARRDLYQGSGVGMYGSMAYGLLGGALDPVGWVAGAGFGKVAEMAGVGGRVLIASGRVAKGAASLAAENALSNVALTAALDATGDHYSSRDYASAAALGALFGTVQTPLHLLGAEHAPDTSVIDHFGTQAENARTEKVTALNRAQQRLGPDAGEDAVAREAAQSLHREDMDTVNTHLAPVPDEQMFLNPENKLTADKGLKDDIHNLYGLDIISDDGSRDLASEMIARSAAQVREVKPQDYHTILEKAGQESTATTLLNDTSPVSKNIAMQLLENPTGAGGRRRTAALSQHIREKMYMEEIRGIDGDYAKFRDGMGISAIDDFRSGEARREFNRRVFLETERRNGTEPGTKFDADPFVQRAADRLHRGYDLMRRDQQGVDTIGSQNLHDHSRGYQPHQMDGNVLIDLHRNDRRTFNHIRDKVYVNQLVKDNGFDKPFALKLANRMLEEAMNRKAKGFDVPLHLRSAEAADLVDAALKAMNLSEEEKLKLRDKFYRGGAAHTKKRLTLDLDQQLPNGKKLADLYNKDVLGLYRGYARRVSGEVGLAQYGIMGKKGLEELRNAAFRSGASERALQAIDQISSEFLNTPFGKHNHIALDNARLATSLARNGGMGFTQLAEYGNGIAALGVHRILGSIASTPRLIGEVRAMVKGKPVENGILDSIETETGQIGLEKYDMTRLFDVPDNEIQPFTSEQLGITTKLLRGAGHLQATLSAHRIIHATQVRGTSEQIVRKAIAMVRKGGMDKHLDDMGIGPELRASLAASMDKIATFKGGRLQKLDIHAGSLTPHDKAVLGQAILRGANQIIQGTFIGETGPWMHNGLLKMMLQFRTFGITSVEKQWGRSMVRNGRGWQGAVRSFATLVGASSLAVPIYLARVKLAMVGKTEAERQDYWNKHVNAMAMGRAVQQYTSMTGFSSDVWDGAGSFASGSLGVDFGEQVGARGQYNGKVTMGTLVPSLGMVEDGLSGVSSLRKKDGSINGKSLEKMGRLLPGSTLPGSQIVWNGITH